MQQFSSHSFSSQLLNFELAFNSPPSWKKVSSFHAFTFMKIWGVLKEATAVVQIWAAFSKQQLTIMYMYAGITHSIEVVLYMYKVSKKQCFLLTYLACWCKRNCGNWSAICNRVRGCSILCTHIQNEKIMTQTMISSYSVAFQLKLWRCSMAVELKSELNILFLLNV